MRFGGLVAVNDLSFEAGRGDITALIGPNGAGKTTVFNCITGFYKPTEGMLTLRHQDGPAFLLERLPGHRIAWRAKVARTFQNIRLFGQLTVWQNLWVAQNSPADRALRGFVSRWLGGQGAETCTKNRGALRDPAEQDLHLGDAEPARLGHERADLGRVERIHV